MAAARTDEQWDDQAAAPSDEQWDDEAPGTFLERDQLVADKSLPVARARLGAQIETALWALRLFVLVVSAMVIYVFVAQILR